MCNELEKSLKYFCRSCNCSDTFKSEYGSAKKETQTVNLCTFIYSFLYLQKRD